MADNYSNDIERYITGAMTAAEKHALEKRALSDPFLADALEGALNIRANEFTRDVKDLQSKVSSASTETISQASWLLRIAASVLAVAVSAFIVWNYYDKADEPKQLALNETAPAGEESITMAKDDSVESAVAGPTSSGTSLAEDKKNTATPPETPTSAGTVVPEETKPVAVAEYNAQADVAVAEMPSTNSVEKNEADALAKNKATEAESVTISRAKEEQAAPAAKVQSAMKRDRALQMMQRKKSDYTTSFIRGQVTSAEDGSALAGVNVIIKGTNIGTVTDQNGNYELPQLNANQNLVYSFIGLQTKEVEVSQQQADVQLFTDAAQLSEVVVTGYGLQKQNAFVPDELAQPVTGRRSFNQYLLQNLRYPAQAIANKTEGKVIAEFFVEADGTLSNFTIVRGIGSGCDEELIRLIKEGPAWLPSKRDGAAIRDKARVQLRFKLP